MKKVIVAAMVIVVGIVSVACAADPAPPTAIAEIEERLAEIEDELDIRHEVKFERPWPPAPKSPAEELSFVQRGVDSMMADKGLESVAEVTVATNDMVHFPSHTNRLSDYLRVSTTNGTYTSTAGGVVTQVTTGFTDSESEQNATRELSNVQTALDFMMANRGLESVTAVTTATNDMTGFPSVTNPLSVDLRLPTTKCTYTVTAGGVVTQATSGSWSEVAIPSSTLTTGFIGSQSEQNAPLELSNVQTALDSMMADRRLESVTAVTTATNDMTGFPSATNKLSDYLRQATTNGTYTITVGGVVTQATSGSWSEVVVPSSSEQDGTLELSNVQTALDSMMADRRLESVTAVTTATNDMTGFPSATNKLSDYLRQATTNGTYTITAGGVVTQATTGYE